MQIEVFMNTFDLTLIAKVNADTFPGLSSSVRGTSKRSGCVTRGDGHPEYSKNLGTGQDCKAATKRNVWTPPIYSGEVVSESP